MFDWSCNFNVDLAASSTWKLLDCYVTIDWYSFNLVEHESLNSSVTQVVIHYTTIHTSQVKVITKQARVITCKWAHSSWLTGIQPTTDLLYSLTEFCPLLPTLDYKSETVFKSNKSNIALKWFWQHLLSYKTK